MLRYIVLLMVFVVISLGGVSARATVPVAIDSRIKTFVYSENEVFRIIVHYGYQTNIEFAEGEEIQTISVGNSFAWQLNPVGRRLFIKPLEDNILTNMTIITNMRTYQFEIQSKMLSNTIDEELVYVIRFFYPDDDLDKIKPVLKDTLKDAEFQEPLPVIQPFNFSYTFTDSSKIPLIKVFDDGINTFFEFNARTNRALQFSFKDGGDYTSIAPKQQGKYILVNKIAQEFRIGLNHDIITVYNENFRK